ncbi:CapA family protein [Candidatus Acetothermia bacterium]|nr:CapA family protein [Candidatus Acetothermia bacterium]
MAHSKDVSKVALSALAGIFALIFSLFGCSFAEPCRQCPSESEKSTLRFAAAGDTNGYNINLGAHSDRDPLAAVRQLISDQDLFIFNLEGVLRNEALDESCPPQAFQSIFLSTPDIANFLHPAAQNVASLANNHLLDCGSAGVEETINALRGEGIFSEGAGVNLSDACKPLLLNIHNLRIALLSYLAMESGSFYADENKSGVASWERCSGSEQVANLAKTTDLVIVNLHLHLTPGWTEETSEAHLQRIEEVLDSGADIVIAHGPHVPQGLLVRGSRVALLSLGDFLFRPDYAVPELAHNSVLAQMAITPEKISISLVPLRMDERGQPQIPTSKEGEAILKEIARLSREQNTSIEIHDGIGYVEVQRTR